MSSCIQQHIASSNNHVTLGLALKLHYKFGSAELVKLLHEHGLVASYDEVLPFRKSAAKYMCDHKKDVSEQESGFSKVAGPLSGWCDSYDLLVCTPNGRRETHCLAMEFMCHPYEDNLTSTSNDENPPPFIIPRLKKSEARNLTLENSSSVTLLHYTGLKKVNSPMVSNNMSAPFEDLCKLKESLTKAQLQDMKWLLSILEKKSNETPLEWPGFMTSLARKQNKTPKPSTPFLFGPLIDSPPAHPATIMTAPFLLCVKYRFKIC